MKVLHVLDWYRPFGGAERLLFSMLEALESAGHENVVIAKDTPGQMRTTCRPEHFLENLEADYASVPALSWLRRTEWVDRLQGEIAEIIRLERPEVAHVHNLQNPFVLKALTRDLPTVRSVHDPRLYCFTNWRLLPDKSICPHALGSRCVTEGCLPKNPFSSHRLVKEAPYRLMHLRAHRDVDVLIAESRATYECYRQNGFPAEQIALLPNMTQVLGSWEDVVRFNERYHDPTGRTVLYVGRASYEKGIDHLVDAMAHVPKPWRLILVTGGPHLAAVRGRIRELGLEDSVELPGVLSYEETRTYYARADVVVFPSVWIESFGLVGLEAMANGKPVAAFRTGGIPDWLDDGRTGLLAPLGDVLALASKIGRLLDDPALARRMGRAGYDRVTRDFNAARYLEGLLKIYEAALEKRSVPAARIHEARPVPVAV